MAQDVKFTRVEFDLPDGMEHSLVADALAAYLQGAAVFGSHAFRPRPMEQSQAYIWHLDISRTIWFQATGNKAVLSTGFENSVPDIHAIIALFKLRYKNWQRPR